MQIVYALKLIKMHRYKELFDLSNFPKHSKYFCNENKKVPEKMKDEYGGRIMSKYTGLKSKMYSIHCLDGKEKSVHKGHNSPIKCREYDDTLFNKNIFRHEMVGIKSKNHKLYTYKNNKVSTSCYDYKGYILSDGINTLPCGHKDIPK